MSQTSTLDPKASLIENFIKGSVSLAQVQKKIGKSRATIYRYAKLISAGKPIEDGRKYGNNRRYGKVKNGVGAKTTKNPTKQKAPARK